MKDTRGPNTLFLSKSVFVMYVIFGVFYTLIFATTFFTLLGKAYYFSGHPDPTGHQNTLTCLVGMIALLSWYFHAWLLCITIDFVVDIVWKYIAKL